MFHGIVVDGRDVDADDTQPCISIAWRNEAARRVLTVMQIALCNGVRWEKSDVYLSGRHLRVPCLGVR